LHFDLLDFQRERIGIVNRYRKEQEIMLSAFHNRGMQDLRTHLGGQQPKTRPEATSWLAQQRKLVSFFCLFFSGRRINDAHY
jgi:hypothetical protein